MSVTILYPAYAADIFHNCGGLLLMFYQCCWYREVSYFKDIQKLIFIGNMPSEYQQKKMTADLFLLVSRICCL